jgi:hypothetical protein
MGHIGSTAIHRLLAFAAVAALLGCANLQTPAPPPQAAAAPPAAKPATPIDAAAVQTIYAVPHREDGIVLHGSHEGAEWTKWTKPDGSVELVAGHGMFADTGKYVIHGNMICTAWGHINGGKQGCERLVRVSPDEYVTYDDDGSEGSRFKVGPP